MSTNRLQRTHRSTKIPNVKLRPVPVSTASRERQRADAEDDAHFQATRDHGTTRGHIEFAGHSPAGRPVGAGQPDGDPLNRREPNCGERNSIITHGHVGIAVRGP